MKCSCCGQEHKRFADVRMVSGAVYCQDYDACQQRVKERAPDPPPGAHRSALSTARDRYGWRSLPPGTRYLGK